MKFAPLAVLRLTTGSNLVVCSTGFAPLRISPKSLRPPSSCGVVGAVGHKAAYFSELAAAPLPGMPSISDDTFTSRPRCGFDFRTFELPPSFRSGT